MDNRQKIERWETPVSDINSLAMVCLFDDQNLTITVQDLRGPEDVREAGRRRWRFTFERVPAYRNILEEYRHEIWENIRNEGQNFGGTLVVSNSSWIKELNDDTELILIHNPNLMHFIICTEDDVVEVLASNWPIIEEIEPASEDAPTPGKSEIYYVPQDRE